MERKLRFYTTDTEYTDYIIDVETNNVVITGNSTPDTKFIKVLYVYLNDSTTSPYIRNLYNQLDTLDFIKAQYLIDDSVYIEIEDNIYIEYQIVDSVVTKNDEFNNINESVYITERVRANG